MDNNYEVAIIDYYQLNPLNSLQCKANRTSENGIISVYLSGFFRR